MSKDGGEVERLAPIIPLFGGVKSMGEQGGNSGAWPTRSDDPVDSPDIGVPTAIGTPSQRHPARQQRTGGESVLPVVRGDIANQPPRLRALHPLDDGVAVEVDTVDPNDAERLRARAEEVLLHKLRVRSLSIAEARAVLRGYERDSARLSAGQVDDAIEEFCRRGYLNDAALADQIVDSGVSRKAQGRVALSRALAQRGLSRDVVAAALADLPDDDAERALEFARTKARSLSRLDYDTALRRLVGQLARRGYSGSIASKAAKSALMEASFGGKATGVRFVDSE